MSVIKDLESELKRLTTKLEGRPEQVLRSMYTDALLLESKVKQELVLLRQRAANHATSTDITAEEAVIEAKVLLGKVLEWIKKIEGKLSGALKDHNTGETFNE